MPAKAALTLALLISCLSHPVTARAQESPAGASPYDIGRGAALPEYFLVRTFFFEGAELYEMGGDWLEFNMLRQMEIKPGSAAEEALVRACLLGREAVTGLLPVATDDDPEISRRRQRESLRTKIHAAAKIYRQMLTELEDAGADLGLVDRYVREDLGQGVAVFSTGGPSEESAEFMEFVRREFRLATVVEEPGESSESVEEN